LAAHRLPDRFQSFLRLVLLQAELAVEIEVAVDAAHDLLQRYRTQASVRVVVGALPALLVAKALDSSVFLHSPTSIRYDPVQFTTVVRCTLVRRSFGDAKRPWTCPWRKYCGR